VKPERAELLETNIKKRLLDGRRHIDGLESAAADFGEDFDFDAFEQAWKSDDPQELKRAYAVQAGYENLLNTCIKLGQELSELEGWTESNVEPSSIEALKSLQQNGVITAKTHKALKDAQERRGAVQHDYANVTVREVYESAREVLEHAPLLLQDVVGQLRQRRA
jgi:uncharacterized protein YutE (UPF0331/DUF86 family)